MVESNSTQKVFDRTFKELSNEVHVDQININFNRIKLNFQGIVNLPLGGTVVGRIRPRRAPSLVRTTRPLPFGWTEAASATPLVQATSVAARASHVTCDVIII